MSKKTVSITGSTLNFTSAGTYTVEYLPSGQVKIKVDGGQSTVLSAAEWNSITSFTFAPGADIAGPVRINGVGFTEAGPGGPFEISHNLNALIGEMLSTHGVAYTVDNLIINDSPADTLKVLWDYLDDAYVAGGNPFNLALNEQFVRLGVEYVDYIENGGTPFTFVTAKYTLDGGDADLLPERSQSMHDNFLGNLQNGALTTRFGSNPALKAELEGLIPDEYQTRPLFEGNDTQYGNANHDAVRTFDYNKGWDRPDYNEQSYTSLVDPLARDGNEMHYGDGNFIDDWNVIRHEGAGVEVAMKIKHRGGDEYVEWARDDDGTAHYYVLAGPSPTNAARAEWNFDFSATDFRAGDGNDFTYRLEFDIDPGAGVNMVTLFSSATHPLLQHGASWQESSNVAFYLAGIDNDPETDGIQPYALGPGTFNVKLSAFDADGGELVAANEVVVHVGEPMPTPLPEFMGGTYFF